MGLLAQVLKSALHQLDAAHETLEGGLPDLSAAGEAAATTMLRSLDDPTLHDAAMAELHSWSESLGHMLNGTIQKEKLMSTVRFIWGPA